MTGTGFDAERATAVIAYKWLRRGATDPEWGFEWASEEGSGVGVLGSPPTALHAFFPGGLPYEVDDELWLQERLGLQRSQAGALQLGVV